MVFQSLHHRLKLTKQHGVGDARFDSKSDCHVQFFDSLRRNINCKLWHKIIGVRICILCKNIISLQVL